MKKILITILILIIVLVSVFCIGCGEKDYQVQEFYDLVKESADNLDIVGDEIYRCWYDYIYNDKYYTLEQALLKALTNKYNEREAIKENDAQIKEYFAKAKEAPCGQKVKEVMSEYSDYYEFVINVSGSFNSYSKEKETKKKALASALRELYYEM